jgi:ubiquinone biosynthesis protein
MLRETMALMRDLHRLQEIASVMVHYGWGDLVKHSGLARTLERAGRLVHWRPARDVEHLDQAVRLRLALTELGPTFVKLGQILATRVDVFAPQWIEELEKLHNQVPPVAFEIVEQMLAMAYGQPIDEVFQSFEREAFAAASIAQVHAAVLPDGTAVVVKVRRPDILPKIEADLRILDHLAQIIELEWPETRNYRPVQIVAQLRRSLLRETDLVKEARNLDTFAAMFAQDDTVRIPKVYWAFCRENVNVQERLEGIAATDLGEAQQAGYDMPLLARRGADAVLQMILVHGHFHADPHPGNIIFLPGNRIGMLDFGMVGQLTMARREQLIQFFFALINKDEIGMLDVLVMWAGDAEVDEERLAYDLTELVMSYDNLSLRNIRLGGLLSDITAILRGNNLALPADLTLLFKTFITLEGLGHQIDQDFHMVDDLEPFIRALMEARYTPTAVLMRTQRSLKELAGIVTGLPRDLVRLLRQARRGRLRIDLDLKRLDSFGGQLNRAANRLTMGILTASLVVGSSIVLTVEGGPDFFGLPLLGALGFTLAVINSAWIVSSIWRSGKE